MKRNHKIIALVCLLLMIPCFMLPASANSRAQEWRGVDSSGAMVIGEDIPIEVTRELLTFDINTLPYASYRDEESFLAYDSKVTAEYTFHNPTDMTITATLLFPYGRFPEYGRGVYTTDGEKYSVTVNGEPVEAKIRHTMLKHSSDSYFDVDNEILKISNDYATVGDFSPDMPVYKYTYTVSGIDDTLLETSSEENRPFLCVAYGGDPDGLYFGRNEFQSHFPDDQIELRRRIDKNYQEAVFYTFGRALEDDELDSYIKCNSSSSVNAIIEKIVTEMTLKDYILADYNEEIDITRIDFYNSVVFNNVEIYNLSSGFKATNFDTDFNYYYLDRWFEYEITLAPGESITNTVVAPLYPQIDAWDKPIKYNYTYYLSPASTWADFGELEILINCPYTMLETNIEGFEKTESGYKYTGQGLPTKDGRAVDLTFTLEGDDTPLHQPAGDFVTAFMEVLLGVVQVVFILIMFIGNLVFGYIESLLS